MVADDSLYQQLTLYGHIKTAEQRTIIQQYGDWYTVPADGWAVTFGTAAQPSPLLAVSYVSPPFNGQCTNFI